MLLGFRALGVHQVSIKIYKRTSILIDLTWIPSLGKPSNKHEHKKKTTIVIDFAWTTFVIDFAWILIIKNHGFNDLSLFRASGFSLGIHIYIYIYKFIKTTCFKDVTYCEPQDSRERL